VIADETAGFLTEVTLAQDSELAGRKIAELPLFKQSKVQVIALKRGGRFQRTGVGDETLGLGDRLVLRLDAAELLTLRQNEDFEVGLTAGDSDVATDAPGLVEATIAPSHPSIGQRLIDIPFLSTLRVRILGVSRFRKVPGPDLPNARIHAVDRLLITGAERDIRQLYANPYLYSVGETLVREFRRGMDLDRRQRLLPHLRNARGRAGA
jgi:Trk K+ transport system NAD-binding subunit